MHVRTYFYLISVVSVLGTALLTWFSWSFVFLYVVILPLIAIGIHDLVQTRRTIIRNFPVIGHLRYLLEMIRPEIMQYFVESDTEGRPFHRLYRSIIYQRSRKVNDTTPFGTQLDVYAPGYEWMAHSIYAKEMSAFDEKPKILIGGKGCKKPYWCSMLNISAMSFGALSKNATMALNKGAKMGGFAHNTGEGGLSPYHLKYGGDLIWQIGTGYFSCRSKEGKFSPEKFRINALLDEVKMIEIKLSQGAKPGHGGILPASKNTPEIAKIRGIEPHISVHSPPSHSAFTTPEELMYFIQKLRDLSDGKPIGFKLCIGLPSEFEDLCKAMIKTGIQPDFITVDGGEGGTGAAPLEFSNSVGMPLRDALAVVYDTLVGYGLKKDIKIICSGKIVTGFQMARVLALGADLCYSARAMMMSVGCIQALKCNSNTCPVGVATQDPVLNNGLDVNRKAKTCANFHEETLLSFVSIVAAAGLNSPQELERRHIMRRVSQSKVMTYEEIYPVMKEGALIKKAEEAFYEA